MKEFWRVSNWSKWYSCFDSTGQLIFDSYDQYVEKYNIPYIDECYAMNVIDGDVWLYYYSEFPLVQMKDKKFICRGMKYM